MTISQFENPENANYVQWTHLGQRILRQYRTPVYAVELASHTGVIVVEPDGCPHNAVIYNADGTERVRLVNPMVAAGAIAFSYPYYVGQELTVNSAIPGLEFGCVFDEMGHLKRVFETR